MRRLFVGIIVATVTMKCPKPNTIAARVVVEGLSKSRSVALEVQAAAAKRALADSPNGTIYWSPKS